MSISVTYTAVLDAKRSTAEHLARLLRDHRIVAGTRKGPFWRPGHRTSRPRQSARRRTG